jgi:archaellum component FlaG (FlaF/FlaG flagellin family)
MKKAVGFLAAVLAIASVLTACSARSPISADDFQKAAQDAGYEVTQDASYGSDAASLVASKSDSDVQITFTVFPDAITAKQKYASQKKSLAVSDGGSTIDSDAYNKYTVQNGEMYYTLVRLDHTLLVCKGTVSDKNEIDNFVKQIKY